MADKADRNALSVAGRYYVDSTCIACGLCASEAPSNFKMSDDGSTAFVWKQPADDAEKSASESALSSCPVQAIGNDG